MKELSNNDLFLKDGEIITYKNKLLRVKEHSPFPFLCIKCCLFKKNCNKICFKYRHSNMIYFEELNEIEAIILLNNKRG